MTETDSRSWQSQVADLTAERIRAETSVAVIKRLGGPGDLTDAEIAYGDGRAETEAVIAALSVALAQGATDPAADLEARMQRAVAARETLARRAEDLRAGRGERSGLVELLAPDALAGLLAAVAALWRRRDDGDKATRAAIADRLEAARWPPFADVKPQ